MARTKRVLLGFAFEGCGISTAKSAGICLHDSAHPAPASSSYEWIPALAVTPSGLDTTINPYTGDWAVSSYTVDISGSDRMRALFFTEQHTPSGALDSALTSTAATVPYDVPGLAGQVIWVNDEAILLGTYSSGVGYTSSTRAYWGTSRQFHIAGSYVYEDATPYWESRLVTMVEHDLSDGTETVRWRGLITDMRTDERGARITIETIEILGALRDAQTNLDAVAWPVSRAINTATYARQITGWTPQVVRGATVGYFQIGPDFIIEGAPDDAGTVTLVTSGFGLVGTVASEDTTKDLSSVYEVCILQSFATLPEPTHPVAICLALLTSTGKGHNTSYDILTERFGLGIDYLDFTKWTDAIAAYPDLSVDRLLLGWDGESVDVLQEVQAILRVYGFFITVTSTGLLGLARLRLLDIGDVDSVQSTTIYPDGPLQWLRSFGNAAQEVVAIVGGLPWEESSTIVLREARRSRRTALLGDARTYDIDLSILSPERVQVSSRESSVLASSLASLLYLGIDAAPRLRVRVPDYRMSSTLTSLDLGDIIVIPSVEVEDGWLLDPEGNLVEDGTDVRFYGMLVGRLWDAITHSYTLELVLMNYRVNNYARLRAPAATVDAWDGAGLLLTLDGTDYGAGSDPASQFEAGDEVTLWNADGTLYASGFHVVDVPSGDELELNAAPSPTPKSGLVLRVAASDVFDNDSRYSGTKRPFAYAAPADGDFDDVDGDSTSDIYGTNIISTSGNDRSSGFDFIGLDEDAITASVDSAQPLDAFVEWTLLDQMSYLIEAGHKVSFTPQTANAGSWSSYTGERPFASVNRSYAVLWPWFVQAGQTGVRIDAIIRNADMAGAGGGCLTLAQFGEEALGVKLGASKLLSGTNTESDTPEFQPESAEITFDAIQSVGALPTSLGITVQSEVASSSIATDSVCLPGLRGQLVDDDGSGFFADTAAARPNVNALDVQAVYEQGDIKEIADMLFQVDDDLVITYPPVQGTPGVATERRSVTYMQLRSCQVTNIFEDTIRSDQAHKGGVPLLAETCAAHFVNAERHYNRMRPVWLGPTWGYSAESGYPNGYTERVIRVAGDASGTLALDANVYLDTVNPKVIVSFYAVGIHATSDLPIGVAAADDSYNTVAPWKAWVQAQNLEDGDSDWSSPTSKAGAPTDKSTIAVTHRVPEQELYPIVRMEQRYQADASPFLLKEGQIFDADLAILQRFDIAATVTNDPSTDTPCRIQLHLDLDSANLGDFGSSDDYAWATPVNNDAANLIIAIYGVSIWEVPQ